MLVPTESFVDAVEKWLGAVRANDLGAAKFHAEHMHLHGDLLAIHPEFRAAFKEHWPDVDPKVALQHLTQFMLCATEARARALKAVNVGHDGHDGHHSG
jgi:hypothetical protein